MAIVYKKNAPHDIYHKDNIKSDCWFCGNALLSHKSDYVVMWSGHGHSINDGNIYLHPDCAMQLSTRLIRDVVQGGMGQPQYVDMRDAS